MSRNVPLISVEYEHRSSVAHPSFTPGEVVDEIRNDAVVGNTDAIEHGLFPEASSPNGRSDAEYNDQGHDAFDGSRNEAEGELVGMVLVPGLNIESK